jgi:hypothetical protein
MARKRDNKESEEMFICPVGQFFSALNETFDSRSPFFDHVKKSRIEFFKAIRALVDEKIESLEKSSKPKKRKRATRIKVD